MHEDLHHSSRHLPGVPWTGCIMTLLACPPPVVHSSFSGTVCVCVCVCVCARVCTQTMLQGSLGQPLPPALLMDVISPRDVGGLGDCADGASPSAHFWEGGQVEHADWRQPPAFLLRHHALQWALAPSWTLLSLSKGREGMVRHRRMS